MKTELANELSSRLPKDIPLLTGIGSLPHHNQDAALQYALKYSIPFAPQIPIRYPKEFMLSQALDGLPGLKRDVTGFVSVDDVKYFKDQKGFKDRLDVAFKTDDYDAFQPSQSAWHCWKSFLWEIEERSIGIAKAQIAGPLTCQWAVQINDALAAEKTNLHQGIFRLVLARSISMIRELKESGTLPIFFLDEPGLYVLSKDNPQHKVALKEMALFIQTLQKEGAVVGVHCCSNTHWKSVFDLAPDILAIDSVLSLDKILSENLVEVRNFLDSGNRFTLGVIPTGDVDQPVGLDEVSGWVDRFHTTLHSKCEGDTSLIQKIISTSIYSPACGLALHRTETAESILDCLLQFTATLDGHDHGKTH